MLLTFEVCHQLAAMMRFATRPLCTWSKLLKNAGTSRIPMHGPRWLHLSGPDSDLRYVYFDVVTFDFPVKLRIQAYLNR